MNKENMKRTMRIQNYDRRKKISALLYALIWSIILIAATFPSFVQGFNFDFLIEPDIIKASQTYLFSLAMVIALHFSEFTYCLYTHDIDKTQLRGIGIANSISIALIAIFLISTVAAEKIGCKIVFFVSVWIVLSAIKFVSLTLTGKPLIELNVPQ